MVIKIALKRVMKRRLQAGILSDSAKHLLDPFQRGMAWRMAFLRLKSPRYELLLRKSRKRPLKHQVFPWLGFSWFHQSDFNFSIRITWGALFLFFKGDLVGSGELPGWIMCFLCGSPSIECMGMAQDKFKCPCFLDTCLLKLSQTCSLFSHRKYQ